MFANIHRELSFSVKHAKCSTLANLLWDRLLAFAVPDGRLSADPTLVRAAAFPLFSFRLDQIERAIAELVAVGLFHRYDVEGKPLLVYHDWKQWGPRLKGVKSCHPPPPLSLCRCCSPEQAKEKEREDSPLLSSPISSEGVKERASGKPQGETPYPSPVRLVAARAFKAQNGGKQAVNDLAAHFVSLENSGAPADFVALEVPKSLGEAPWACCDRVREAWKVERRRREESELRAANSKPEPIPPEDPNAAVNAEAHRAQLRKAGISV